MLHLFKARGESTHQVYLKVLAYAFWLEYGDLTFDPKTDYKLDPAVAALDWTGEVRLWIHVGPLPFDKLEYLLRHTDAEEVCWVLEAEGADAQTELEALLARVRRHIHYRYTDRKLRVLMFEPIDPWFDPAHVAPDPACYRYFSF